jgi:hypothetical protein
MAKKAKAPPQPKVTLEGLDDEQQQALFFQHRQKVEVTLAAKKKADAEFKNACKAAKADLGDGAVDDIKLSIDLDTEAGQARAKGKIESMHRVARWMGVKLGAQVDMFSADDAFEAGKRASMNDEPPKPPTHYAPSSPEYARWLDGYSAGTQARAAKTFGENPPGAFEAHDPAKIGEAPATFVRQ